MFTLFSALTHLPTAGSLLCCVNVAFWGANAHKSKIIGTHLRFSFHHIVCSEWSAATFGIQSGEVPPQGAH